jgi:hypothetical protein
MLRILVPRRVFNLHRSVPSMIFVEFVEYGVAYPEREVNVRNVL